MKCYVKSCIADFGADAKSSIKCNTLIMEIKITEQLHSLPRCRALRQNRSRRERETDDITESRKLCQEKNPTFFPFDALIQSLYSQDENLKNVCILIFWYQIVKYHSFIHNPVSFTGTWRTLENKAKNARATKNKTYQLGGKKRQKTPKLKKKPTPRTWHDAMYCFFQVGERVRCWLVGLFWGGWTKRQSYVKKIPPVQGNFWMQRHGTVLRTVDLQAGPLSMRDLTAVVC